MRRYSFSLIEVLVSTSLAIIVITACISLFCIMQQRITTAQAAYTDIQHLCQKTISIRRVLQNIRLSSSPRAQKYPFYTEDQACIFVFNNDIDLRLGLSGTIDGMLYLDPRYGLLLVQKSKINDLPREAAVCLWPNAESISWRFFPSPASSLPQQWYSSWEKQWHAIPCIIELTITEPHQPPHVITAIVAQAIDDAIVATS